MLSVSSGSSERVSIPRVALGTFRSTGDDAATAVRCALRQTDSLRAIDTASIYRNELEVGREIRDAIRDGIVSRADLFITSKISPFEMGAAKAPAAVEGILRRLDIGYLDLLLIHWPGWCYEHSRLTTHDARLACIEKPRRAYSRFPPRSPTVPHQEPQSSRFRVRSTR